MALPLLLGLAGSGLAGAGMLGSMGALTAGALGSGLGSYLETGDLGKGIQTGLTSFLGGKLLGAGADMIGGADAASAATQATPTAQMAADPMLAGTNIPTELTTGTMTGGVPSSSGNMFSNMFSDSTTGIGSSIPADATMGQRFAGAKSALMTPEAIGAGLGTALAIPPPDFEKKKSDFNTAEADAADRERFNPGKDFRPGIDNEFNYFGPIQYADGGIASLRYQEGGEAMSAPNDKDIISNAVDAIQGKDESPERALAMFVSRYGEDALRDLVQRVQSGQFDENAETTEGKVNGVGDGMDDMIPATLEGDQDVVLSDGEFIVPADVVSGLGNGSTDAGSKSLYEMMDRVRKLRTGKTSQPDQVPQESMLPV